MNWSEVQVTLIDVLDVMIVIALFYYIYKLLRGTRGFDIFIGIVLLYFIWFLVSELEMRFLSKLFGQFINIGLLVLIIIFQPEIRRFLLILGDSTLKRREHLLKTFFTSKGEKRIEENERIVNDIMDALTILRAAKVGALIVMTSNDWKAQEDEPGTYLHAKLSSELLQSIFNNQAPLHDGAVIIRSNEIIKAGVVLPLASQAHLPSYMGLRHRAGLGATVNTEDFAIVLSDERRHISIAYKGELTDNVSDEYAKERLYEFISNDSN